MKIVGQDKASKDGEALGLKAENEDISQADPQLRLLALLEKNSRKSHFVQIISFIFGVLVSSITIIQQVFNFGSIRSTESLLLVAGVLGFGFALIIFSLAVQSRQDSDVRSSINTVSRNVPTDADLGGAKDDDEPTVKIAENRKESSLFEIRSRINEHVRRLRAFAFANIIIGSIIAATGILVIFSLFSRILNVSYSEITTLDNAHYQSFFVIVFLPRISIVILIQIFAYFFLSMYRANLREIRYFQIELNDLELVAEAVEIARSNNIKEEEKILVNMLFDMVKYRGDSFRLGISSDEALETFQALAGQGNLLGKLKIPFASRPKTTSAVRAAGRSQDLPTPRSTKMTRNSRQKSDSKTIDAT